MKLSFGWQTALLLESTAVLLSLSYSLWRSLHNRKASRTLAMLLVVLAGIFTPWTIGYAGFYDRWKWLTFLPVSVPLWVPALLYLYNHSLLHGSWPQKARRLLLPGALEFAYQAVSFCLPLALKLRWADAVWHITGSIFGSALIVGFVLQTYFSLKEITIYKKAAADALSSDSREATQWLERSLVAFACLWIAWAAAIIADTVSPIGYGGFLLLYLLIAVFAIYLAVEGWRHTLLPFPVLSSIQPSGSAAPPSQGKDWQTRGELWAATLRQEGWVRDPDLTLAALARKLGTNTAYLSRALNEGLGVNFSTLVNRVRSELVAHALKQGSKQDILDLALDAGFASKASFNRAFSATFGITPSAYRRSVSDSKNKPDEVVLGRPIEADERKLSS